MRALLGAPVSRDRGAVPRQAHNLKVARATRAPASSFGLGKAKGYFTWKRKTLGDCSRRRFGSGVEDSYFALGARGRRFDSCRAPVPWCV